MARESTLGESRRKGRSRAGTGAAPVTDVALQEEQAQILVHRSGWVRLGLGMPAWIRTECTGPCEKCHLRRLVLHESVLLTRFLAHRMGPDAMGLRFHLLVRGCLERRKDRTWVCAACQGVVDAHLPPLDSAEVISSRVHLQRLRALLGPSVFVWDTFTPMRSEA